MKHLSNFRECAACAIAVGMLLGLALASVHGAATVATAPAPTPRVLHAGLVAPEILGITIQDGALIRGAQEPYAAQPGDAVKVPTSGYTPANTPQLWRGGAFVGWLVQGRTILSHPDRTVGFLPSSDWLGQASAYTIQATDDPRFSTGGRPAQVYRKSIPNGAVRKISGVTQPRPTTVRHTVYLRLVEPWKQGVEYRISFPAGLPPLTVTISDRLESEAIHATQIGFRPADESKVAFLSCWLGGGGPLAQPATVPFKVIDAEGQEVFRGAGAITTRAQDNESLPSQPRNLSRTDVVLLDFSPVKNRGEYRVIVPGIGSSYPITIAEDVWRKAFTLSMKGFYHQRSGLELKAPWSSYHRPRNMHPADGVKIYLSDCTLMDSRNGLNALGNDPDNFGNLVKGATTQLLEPGVWGGYADAGDWDRRINHLTATRGHLDLLLEVGEPIEKLQLNIPESGNGLPDLLDEALWNLDFYRRLMTPEGGVRGGIESAEHPKAGEGSWQESWPRYAYAPDAWSSYIFVATAARCAHYADKKYPEVAALYRAAALKAMGWAEAELARLPADYLARRSRGGTLDRTLDRTRNLAAADLYRLTGEPRWHELFLKTFGQCDEEAAWVYLRTSRVRDPERVAQCRENLLRAARQVLEEQRKTGFRWTRRGPGAENYAWAFFSSSAGCDALLRAWRLTGEARYRQGAVLGAQLVAGANPNNMAYTSGLGRNPMRNIFAHDTLVQGLEPPAGLTAMGPFNPAGGNTTLHSQISGIAPFFTPPYREWPQTEFCLDSGLVHPIDEYTPDGSMSPVSYLWGSLAF